MRIRDLYDVNIYLDGIDICNFPNTSLLRGEIFESINNPIPTCEIEVIVPVQWLNFRAIVDGTPIVFQISSEELHIDEAYNFKVFNITKIDVNQNAVQLIINGVIDFFKGYENAIKYTMYGSSSDIFKRIASENFLDSEIDQTNDIQLWHGEDANIFQFLNNLAKYGWINELSAMIWFIDRQKRLIYKNLTTLFRERQNKIWYFRQINYPDFEEKYYPYTNIQASIQAGTNNLANQGYGGADYCFKLTDYKAYKVNSNKVIAESNVINISKESSQGLNSEWLPFDVGNFNPNYWLAYKQNQRILSTYSSYITLSCQLFCNYRLGQVVNLEYLDSQDSSNRINCLSGTYMLDAIHISITQNNISATIEAVMQGVNGLEPFKKAY